MSKIISNISSGYQHHMLNKRQSLQHDLTWIISHSWQPEEIPLISITAEASNYFEFKQYDAEKMSQHV